MDLSVKFMNGLMDKHNMEAEDIKNWVYCGGDFKQHRTYFDLCFPSKDGQVPKFPELSGECICKTKIVNSCFIRPTIDSPVEDILIVGACCIEKFLPNGFKRFCEQCRAEHKRRTVNICFECEKKEESVYVYFDFSYDKKDEVKTNGAKWDTDYELWYVRRAYKPKFIEDYTEFIIPDVDAFVAERERKRAQKIIDDQLFSEGKYTCKYFSFADKDRAKAEGYQWDKGIKKWWKAVRPIGE